MPLAVIAFEFEPVVRVAGLAIRLDTLVAALGILTAILVAALIARRTPAGRAAGAGQTLRLDDLMFVLLAAGPGALIGGRLGYVLLHLDYYAANRGAIVDPALGSLELTLAVVGGALTGGYGARVLSGSAGRWFHVAAIPTLLAIGIGKVSMALGGAGQGAPSDLGWATRYLGAGPWGSLAPDIAAHPAQLYEAAATALIALVVVSLGATGLFERRDGMAWLAAVGSWALARALIATTWRDPIVAGPFRMEQAIAILVALGCVALAAWIATRPERLEVPTVVETRWPDPETRPNF